MMSTTSNVSLYISYPDGLSFVENGVLKLPAIIGLLLVRVFKSRSRFIFKWNSVTQSFLCICLV